MPGVFACVTRWCVRGVVHIWCGTVVVDDVWLLVVGMCVTFSTVIPKFFDICCISSPCFT